MTTTAISRLYPLYITQFEAVVTGLQKTVDRLRSMEQTYNLLRSLLIDLENAGRMPDMPVDLRLRSAHIDLSATLRATDRLASATYMLEAIGAALYEAGLRHRAGSNIDLYFSESGEASYAWSITRPGPTADKPGAYFYVQITFRLELDQQRCADYELVNGTRTLEWTTTTLTPIIRGPAPCNSRPV